MKTLEQKLKAKFKQEDLESRILRSGAKDGKVWATVAFYVNARAVQDRLDEACGIGGWKNLVNPTDKGVLCTLSIKFGEEWVSKQDGADYSKQEAFKGGISGSLKRAAVQFGIGRYLYELKESWAVVSMTKQDGDDWNYVKANPKAEPNAMPAYWWKEPKLPAQFLPEVQSNTIKTSKFEGVNNEQLRQSVLKELKGLCKQVVDDSDYNDIDFESMELEDAQVQLKTVKEYIKKENIQVKAV